MEQNTLKELTKKYEIKRIKAIDDLEMKKRELFLCSERLKQIEENLNSIAIKTAKSILHSNSKNSYLEELQNNIANLKIEKTSILKQLNLDDSYLEPKYECKVCNDTGYITKDSKTDMCSCFKQELFDIAYNKSNIGNFKKEIFKNFDLSLYSDEINAEKYKSDISPRENIKIIKELSETFIKNIDNLEEKNLIFIGNPGTGKTFLSNCIANEILSLGKNVLYQTAPVLLDTIINYRFGKNNISLENYNNYLEVDLLIIDDLGTESLNSMKFTELFSIINTRLLNQNNKSTKTIISTNLSLNELFSTYDERIVSRIIGNYTACRFFGEDIRLLKKGLQLK